MSPLVAGGLPPSRLNHIRVAGEVDMERPVQVTLSLLALAAGGIRNSGAFGETLQVIPKTAADTWDVVDTVCSGVVSPSNRSRRTEATRRGIGSCGEAGDGKSRKLHVVLG